MVRHPARLWSIQDPVPDGYLEGHHQYLPWVWKYVLLVGLFQYVWTVRRPIEMVVVPSYAFSPCGLVLGVLKNGQVRNILRRTFLILLLNTQCGPEAFCFLQEGITQRL